MEKADFWLFRAEMLDLTIQLRRIAVRITQVKELQEQFQKISDSALSILEQSIGQVVECAKILDDPSSQVRDFRGFIEHLMAVHLRVIAGVCYGRSTFDYKVVEDPLIRVYALTPWKYGLFVREALYEVITNTTLHPASFMVLFELIPQCKKAIKEAKERGAIAAPQEEMLLRKCVEAAWRYLHFSSAQEVGDRGFDTIVDCWIKHEDSEIAELAKKIKEDFHSH